MTKVSESVEEDQGSMVLRTVYLPAQLDDELKKLAFHGSTSKGALIRKALYNLVADPEALKAADPVGSKAKPR
jgi:predicted transcriptional regulator